MNKDNHLLLLVVIGYGSPAQTIQSLERNMYGIAFDATEGRFMGQPDIIVFLPVKGL